MKSQLLLLVLTGTACWAEPVAVNTLLDKPSAHVGRPLTVEALVDRVSAERRMAILLDASEAACGDACEKRPLLAGFADDVPLPQKGSIVRLEGRLSTDPLKLEVSAIAPAARP